MRETENSEDGVYVERVNEAIQKLRASELLRLFSYSLFSLRRYPDRFVVVFYVNNHISILGITSMVADAKSMVLAMDDPSVRERWRASSRNLVDAVSGVGQVVEPTYLHSTATNAGSASQRNILRDKEAPVSDAIPIAELRQLYIQGTGAFIHFLLNFSPGTNLKNPSPR